MKTLLSKLNTGLLYVIQREDGQDLTQVALIIALVAVGATAGMNSVATAVGNAFGSLSGVVAHMGGVLIK